MRAPSIPAATTAHTERPRTLRRIVELVDVYPTLCDLARIPCPPRTVRSEDRATGGARAAAFETPAGWGVVEASPAVARHEPVVLNFEGEPPLDGQSLVPWLLQVHVVNTSEGARDGRGSTPSVNSSRRPNRGSDGTATEAASDEGGAHHQNWGARQSTSVADAETNLSGGPSDLSEGLALSTYPRCAPRPPSFSLSCNSLRAQDIRVMGTSVRSATHRFVVWTEWQPLLRRPIFLGLDAHLAHGDVELYSFSGSREMVPGPSAPSRGSDSGQSGKDLGQEVVNLAEQGLTDVGTEHTARSQLDTDHAASIDTRAVCERLYAHAKASWPDVSPPPAPPKPSFPPSEPLCADTRSAKWCPEPMGSPTATNNSLRQPPPGSLARCAVPYVAARCRRSCGRCADSDAPSSIVSDSPPPPGQLDSVQPPPALPASRERGSLLPPSPWRNRIGDASDLSTLPDSQQAPPLRWPVPAASPPRAHAVAMVAARGSSVATSPQVPPTLIDLGGVAGLAVAVASLATLVFGLSLVCRQRSRSRQNAFMRVHEDSAAAEPIERRGTHQQRRAEVEISHTMEEIDI